MKTIKIWNDNPSEKQLAEIASDIEAGMLIVFPTDTLYAVGCDALNSKSIDRICELKHINPQKTNLSIICSDISMAAEYARIDNETFRIMRENCPGPFTFLLKAASSLPKAFKGRKVVGIRIPDNNTIRQICKYIGHPLLSTTIEYESEDYAVNPELIAETHENKADIFILGEEGGTEPSTIVDCTGNEIIILREGKGELK